MAKFTDDFLEGQIEAYRILARQAKQYGAYGLQDKITDQLADLKRQLAARSAIHLQLTSVEGSLCAYKGPAAMRQLSYWLQVKREFRCLDCLTILNHLLEV